MIKKLWNKTILFLGRDYLAGSSLEEGYTIVEEFRKRGLKSTFDIVGEDATTREEANFYVSTYKKIADYFSRNYKGEDVASISLKPTAICAVNGYDFIPETQLSLRLIEFVDYAHSRGIRVTLDMEDHHFTDATIESVRNSWRNSKALGLVLQSRLNRTEKDIDVIFSEEYPIPRNKLRVRIVIGVYVEPEDIAINDKKIAKERLVDRVAQLFDKGVYVEIATHDHAIINRIINEIIVPRSIPSNRFEFQFLKGVQNAYMIEGKLLKMGYSVRYYMPVELEKYAGVPYMTRRALENPDFIKHGVKNIFQKVHIFFRGKREG